MGLVAAIFAHPDDEILGCGSTLALHAAAGDEVRILLLSSGVGARGTQSKGEVSARVSAAHEAAEIVGASSVSIGAFSDNEGDRWPLLEVVRYIEAFLSEFRAATVYTHWAGDLNVDHRITHQATVTALRPLPGRAPLTILACEVPSASEWGTQGAFTPTEFVDISRTFDNKRRALNCYVKEMRTAPHPRSFEGVETLARLRGMQSGFPHAEAFQTVRRVGSPGGSE
jgi:N-acetylglucosamine malate deacetylase 1